MPTISFSSCFCISTPCHTLHPPSDSTTDETDKETTGGFFDSEDTPNPVQFEWSTFSHAQPHTQEEVERHIAKLNAEEAAAKEKQDTEEAEEDPNVEIPDKEPLDINMTEMMDINAIHLFPVERAERMKHNKCFICHKVGCHTKNHLQDWSRNQGPPCPPRNPAWVRATTTTSATIQTLKPKSELAQFVGSLERKGTTKEEILQVLATCFAEEDEGNVRTVATAKVEEVEDF